MLGGLIAVAIAVWFYRTAMAKGAEGFQWGLVGIITYYVPNFLWSVMVAKPVLVNLHKQTAPIKYSLWGYSSVFVGLAVVLTVWYLVLNRLKVAE